MATDPEEWSEELKTRLLALRPDNSIEEIAEMVRRRVRRQALTEGEKGGHR